MNTPILLDKHGREILAGDTLKIFHFIGARRKKHYMYKHVIERVMLGKDHPAPFYKVSHLGLCADSYYWLRIDGSRMAHTEIVQGYGSDGTPFDLRPKHST